MTKPAFSITSASLITVLGALGTAVAALVPNWTHETQAIVATLGTVVTAVFPLVNALHYKAAHPSVLVHPPAPALPELSLVPDVGSLLKDEVAKTDVDALVRAELNRVLSRGLVPDPSSAPATSAA